MNDFKTLSVYASHAQKYDALTNHEVKTDPLLERFISGIPNGGRTLDIGCGPGNSAGIMAANGLKVDAWDLVSEMLQLTQRFPGVSTRRAGYADLDSFDLYDGIWSNFSMLHTPRSAWPLQMKAIKKALCPNGLFHISLKLGIGEKRDKIGRLYSYVTENELNDLLQAAGLEPKFTAYGRNKGLSGEIADWIAVQARG